MMDTIFAQATASGRAGVSVVRLSGPEAFHVAGQLCKIPNAGEFGHRAISDRAGNLIDRGLILSFEAGKSFTGEETIEFQTHGSVAIVSKLLKELGKFENCRLAEQGEFTRRALENGNLDITQVEALADLLEAETELQRLQAMRVFEGELRNLAVTWRSDLTRALALLEASIDFSDEEIPTDLPKEVLALTEKSITSMYNVITASQHSDQVRDGFKVAIVGAPNVGKSTLLNAMAGREAAITSNVAGTTRDVIEVRLDISGLAVTLLDTAGIRDSDDEVEVLGVERARDRARTADLRMFLIEEPDERLLVDQQPGDIIVLNKADLRADGIPAVSGSTGAGVSDLLQDIYSRLSELVPSDVAAIRERQKAGLSDAVSFLKSAQAHLSGPYVEFELAAFEVRGGMSRLDFVFGKVDLESVLDEIFSSFCLGK